MFFPVTTCFLYIQVTTCTFKSLGHLHSTLVSRTFQDFQNFHRPCNFWPSIALVQPNLLKFLFHIVNVFIFALRPLIWQFLQIFNSEIFSFYQCTFQKSNQLFTFICTSTFIRELIVYFLKFSGKVQISFLPSSDNFSEFSVFKFSAWPYISALSKNPISFSLLFAPPRLLES